jgi:hypothetical protein
MPEGKTINLLGVLHEEDYFNDVARALVSRFKPGQSIGIEVDPQTLRILEKVFNEIEIKKKGKNFDNLYYPYLGRSLDSLVGKLIPSLRNKISLEQFNFILEHQAPQFKFYYDLFALAKKKGLKVEALDSGYANTKLSLLALKRIALRSAKKNVLEDLISWPARERFMVSRIAKLKPDFVVVGSAHLIEIGKQLIRQGIKTKTIYHRKARGMYPVAPVARFYYKKRQKQVEKRLRMLRQA